MGYFESNELRAKLKALGFVEVEELGPQQIAARYFPSRAGAIPDKGGHILRATTISLCTRPPLSFNTERAETQ